MSPFNPETSHGSDRTDSCSSGCSVLGQAGISHHAEAELHLAGATRGWDPACCPTHSAHPNLPHGVCVAGCGPGEPDCHPATCHQRRASLRREGPGSRSVSCQLRVGRHLSCSKASHSSLWKGEGRFKDTAACEIMFYPHKQEARKWQLKARGFG